jgi:hypothetical protein
MERSKVEDLIKENYLPAYRYNRYFHNCIDNLIKTNDEITVEKCICLIYQLAEDLDFKVKNNIR